jgi:hypothetical protein
LLKSEQTIKLFELNHRKFTPQEDETMLKGPRAIYYYLRKILEPPMTSTHHPTSSHKTPKEMTDRTYINLRFNCFKLLKNRTKLQSNYSKIKPVKILFTSHNLSLSPYPNGIL